MFYFGSKSSFSGGSGGASNLSFGGGKGGARSQHLSRLSNHNVPPGSSDNPYKPRPKAEFDGIGWDGGSKVSFNFLHTL